MAKQKTFNVPSRLLAQLNECSAGGYFLMTIDIDGNPKVCSQFDSQVHASAMQYYLQKWIGSIEELNSAMTTQSILSATSVRRKRKR